MTFEIYQWLVPLFGVFYISRTIYQYLHNKRSASSTFVWIIFWVAIMLLGLVPHDAAVTVANALGFKDHINAIIFVAIGLLFLFIFYLSTTVEKLEDQVTNLVRKIALEESEKNKNAQQNFPKQKKKKVRK